ncbi:hypothetical protein FKM82_008627 [Ascaphus truei]
MRREEGDRELCSNPHTIMAWRRASAAHRGENLFLRSHSALVLLVLCRAYGSFAGPIHVDPHITAVWGKNITLKCLIEVNETITQISWEKTIGKSAQTIAVHHPDYGTSFQESYQERTTFKNTSLYDATIVINNIAFSDSGEYICKAVTFPLGNVQSSTTVTVFVQPTVSVTKGPNPLMDGANETVAAFCTAATGKPAAEVYWEGSLGNMETNSSSYPNKTITVLSQYKLIPTRFARGRNVTCVVKHPALENDIRYPFTLDIQYPPATTRLPTIPQTHSTIAIASLATASKKLNFSVSTVASMQDENFGTIVGSVIGGSLFLILVIVLSGIIYYKRKQTFRGDYFTKSYIPPSDMQKESQIDVLQPEDLDPFAEEKKKNENRTNDLIYNEYLHDIENSDWNNIGSYNRYQEQFDRPMNDYADKKMPTVQTYNKNCFNENEDDLVSHVDGSVISRREWYV